MSTSEVPVTPETTQDPRTIYGNVARVAASYWPELVPPPPPLDIDYLIANNLLPTSVPLPLNYPIPIPAGTFSFNPPPANAQYSTDWDTLTYIVGWFVSNPNAPGIPSYYLQGTANCVFNPFKYKGFTWKYNGQFVPGMP